MKTGVEAIGCCVNLVCEIKAYVTTERGVFYDLDVDGCHRWLRVPADDVERYMVAGPVALQAEAS